MHPDDKARINKVDESEPIKINSVDSISSSMSLRDFIYRFWTYWNVKYPTSYIDGRIHCMPGASRSITDLFLLTSYYFNDIRYDKVKDTVLSFGLNLRGHVCPDIERRVCSHVDAQNDWAQYGFDDLDEYGDAVYYLDNDGNKITTLNESSRALASLYGYGPDKIEGLISKLFPRFRELFVYQYTRFSPNSITVMASTHNGTPRSFYISSPKYALVYRQKSYVHSAIVSITSSDSNNRSRYLKYYRSLHRGK